MARIHKVLHGYIIDNLMGTRSPTLEVALVSVGRVTRSSAMQVSQNLCEARIDPDLTFSTSAARYLGTTIRTVPSPLQNRQRSPSISFPEPAHSRHLATIWNSASVVSGVLPGISLTTSAW
jgi:hypothetical protein